MTSKEKRMKMIESVSGQFSPSMFSGKDRAAESTHTENELFRRCQHVQRKGDFVLVLFQLKPLDERRYIGFARASVCVC